VSHPAEGLLDNLPVPFTGASMSDHSMTGSFQFKLPQDLLSESKRAVKPKNEQLHVDQWRISWLSRLTELLVGRD
jgi:hypothetical protein